MLLPSKNAGIVLGADGEGFLVGSGECSRYSRLSLPALPLSVRIHSLACELEPSVRRVKWRGWRVSWKPELQARFCCLGCEDGGLHQYGDITECKPELMTAGEIFLSGEACL